MHFLRRRNHARIGGVNAVNIRINIATIGF